MLACTAVTAATGIDTMVYAVEAYTSARLKNPLSDLLARDASAAERVRHRVTEQPSYRRGGGHDAASARNPVMISS